MNKLDKKYIAILISLLILSSFLTTVSASYINNNLINITESKTKKMVTLTKFGINGSIELIKIEIENNECEDINELIEQKCIELINEDPEFQQLRDNNTFNQYSLISSRGRGFHIKFTPSFSWPIKSKISQLLSIEKLRKIKIPIVFCRYTLDSKAYTNSISILNSTNKTINVKGPHSVLSIGFYGFKWWIGRISWRGFLLRSGFIGFSLVTIVREF